MRRRHFIAGLGSAAAWPVVARAQQARMRAVGYLYVGSPETSANQLAGFRKGLSEAGFVEGRNIAIEFGFAHNEPSRLPELADGLVRRRVAVIAAIGVEPAIAAKAAATSIPVVIAIGGDPVEAGLVTSLNRPGGNITGVSFMGEDLGSKQLGLLHELAPQAARFGVLLHPTARSDTRRIAVLQAAAAAIDGQIEVRAASTIDELDAAFASLVAKRADALVVSPDGFFANRRVQFATLAAYHRLPAIYPQREFPEIGGMMSYGASVADQVRQAGLYVGRILEGDKPADLPVLQPTKFEFVINLHTVKMLGLTIPETLLATADEVIQ
jgi:putative ABC transport system substrate-binding protein